MKEPGSLSGREPISRKTHTIRDFNPDTLRKWALETLNPKFLRLLHTEVDPILRPESLRATFTEEEVGRIFEHLLRDAFYEIADLTGSSLLGIRDRSVALLGGLPFEITMTAAAIRGQQDEELDASSANLLDVHAQAFSPDPVTVGTTRYLLDDDSFHNDAAGNAICLDIHGAHDQTEIDFVNNHVISLSDLYGYTSRVVKPTLNMALQGAISRMSLDRTFRPTNFRTTAKGPKGSPILVMATSPQIPIIILEEADLMGSPTGLALPEELMINNCLIKQLIAREDLN